MVKRSLIILVAVWAVLLLAPMFRLQTQRSLQNARSSNLTDANYYVKPEDWANLKRSNPNNARLALRDLVADGDPNQPRYWLDLDALVARFPDDLNLRRARLVETTRGSGLVRPIYQPARVPGNPALPPNAANLQKAAELKKAESWQNEAQRVALVRAARAGQKQAPNDGFFFWMEAMALWNRDDEPALRALERAAKTSGFDDGIMANGRTVLQLREQLRPLDWDEKLASNASITFPHYAPLRNLAREVTWSGIAHYRRGDQAGAYRRWRIALEAGGAFRRSASRGPQSNLIALLVAEALQAVVWQTVAPELNPPPKVADNASGDGAADATLVERLSSDDKRAANLRAFEALARRDGQGALADYAAAQSAAFEAREIYSPSAMDTVTDKLGISAPVPVSTLQLLWIGHVVLLLTVVGGAGLLACLVWRRRVGGARWFGASGAQIAFFAMLWLGALLLGGWQSTLAQMQQMTYVSTNGDPLPWLSDALKNPWPFWFAVALTLLSSMALCYLQAAREDRRLRDQTLPRAKHARRPASLSHFFIGGAWAAVLASACLWTAMPRSQNEFLGTVWAAFALLAVALTVVGAERGNAPKMRARLFVVCAVCALVSFGCSVWFGFASSDAAALIILLGLLVATLILLYLGVTSTGWRPLFGQSLAVALQTMGGVALVCTLALLLASLWALPIRARQNRIVDDYIARGELDWMRAQPSIRNASAPVK